MNERTVNLFLVELSDEMRLAFTGVLFNKPGEVKKMVELAGTPNIVVDGMPLLSIVIKNLMNDPFKEKWPTEDLEYLLKMGADPNVEQDGTTPMGTLAYKWSFYGWEEVARLLARYGGSPDKGEKTVREIIDGLPLFNQEKMETIPEFLNELSTMAESSELGKTALKGSEKQKRKI